LNVTKNDVSAWYSSFGEVSLDVEIVPGNLRFAGQYFDAETGLHYNYHRYFSPETGRYLIADPVGFDGGMNLYVYSENNPLKLIDAMGLSPSSFYSKDRDEYYCKDRDEYCRSEKQEFASCNRKALKNKIKCFGLASKKWAKCTVVCAASCTPLAKFPHAYLTCIAGCAQVVCNIVVLPDRLKCVKEFFKDLVKCEKGYDPRCR
jgi:RHS repeat-associated protein